MTDASATLQTDAARIEAYLHPRRATLPRPAEGRLRHRYVDPDAGYRGQLWDWDCLFTLLALGDQADPALIGECVDNFVDHQRSDGSIPYVIPAHGDADSAPRSPQSPRNSAKPVLAQMAVLAGRGAGAWLDRVIAALARHLEHWDATQRHASGLYVWRSHRGSGADNHPAVYGRPQNSSAGVDLNSLMVAEFAALATLCRAAGDHVGAAHWADRSAEQARLTRELLWDPVTDAFVGVDVSGGTPAGVTQPVTWLTPLRYRSWTTFYPLWTGIATQEQAAAVVAGCDLVTPWGVRTLSAREPLYSVAASGNPSNWQGPVWLVSNYIVSEGARRYGHESFADEVAAASVRLLAHDLEATGTLHEYYDPDTGNGITGAGFLNWNLLVAPLARRLLAP